MSSRPWVKRILFWVVLVAVPLIFVELFLRVYFATQVGPDVLLYGIKSSRYQSVFDPVGSEERKESANRTVDSYNVLLKGYWKYSPHQDVVERNEEGVFKVAINSLGFRGTDFEASKRPGTLRVIALGASSTFGYHDKDNETYPSYLQDSLARLLRNRSCGPWDSVEVLNLGIPHLETDNILSLFIHEGLPLNPDVVTFYEGINDAHVDRAATGPPGMRRGWLRRFLDGIYFGLRSKVITVALIGNLHTTLAMRFSPAEVTAHAQGKVERFLHNISAINDECKKRGIVFIVLNQQAKSLMIDTDKIRGITYDQEVEMVKDKLRSEGHVPMGGRDLITHSKLMDAERAWTNANHVSFVDIISALDARRDCLVSWVHLNAEGNKIVSSVLAKEILKDVCQK